jgi:guanylate kinase
MNSSDLTKGGMKHCGRMFIVSAPSGAGKTTLCKAVRENFPDMLYSVSHTTRAPRSGEVNGVDYFFIDTDEFKENIHNHKWAEWAEVHGNFYGTSIEFLNGNLAAARDILLDIDVQGTIQILRRYPDCITIFIMPPSLDVLRGRLESRGTDSEAIIQKRLQNAEAEMEKKSLYRHIIINDDLSEAIARILSLIKEYRTCSNFTK